MQLTPQLGIRSTPEEITVALAARGAIMHVIGQPALYYLVGSFAWLGPRHVFWFVAHGDAEVDGRVIEFDESQVLNRERIAFVRNRSVVAYLVSIENAGVEDPDDYHVAWQIWQQVAPAQSGFIARLLARHAELGA
ncbi:MAG TPA: hypothetical protein VHE61_08500 [Opitutaceae bacterium]|nr:hypothetical protein [Opitutaceae bacterium]